jgi:hypothetical protein
MSRPTTDFDLPRPNILNPDSENVTEADPTLARVQRWYQSSTVTFRSDPARSGEIAAEFGWRVAARITDSSDDYESVRGASAKQTGPVLANVYRLDVDGGSGAVCVV